MREFTRNNWDETFRADALALLKRSNRSLTGVAADLGVPYSTLRAWYKADMAKKRKGAKGVTPKLPVGDPATETPEQKVNRLERENAVLRKKVDELEMDRAILKKAAAFFAKESE